MPSPSSIRPQESLASPNLPPLPNASAQTSAPSQTPATPAVDTHAPGAAVPPTAPPPPAGVLAALPTPRPMAAPATPTAVPAMTQVWLEPSLVTQALALPAQTAPYACGLEQMLRCCVLLGVPLPDRTQFFAEAPLVSGTNKFPGVLMEEVAANENAARLAPDLPPIGPPPHALCRYINKHFDSVGANYVAYPLQFQRFDRALLWLDAQIEGKLPAVVLTATGPASWHYLIGMANNRQDKALFIDTRGTQPIAHTYQQLGADMQFDSFKLLGLTFAMAATGLDCGGWIGLYNGIEFRRAPVARKS